MRHVERAQKCVLRGFALYVHFYLPGRRSAALHALYIAVATFKIACCTTRRAQIYSPPPHTSSRRFLRVVPWSLHSPRDHANTAVSLARQNYSFFFLFDKNSATLETDNISRARWLKRANIVFPAEIYCRYNVSIVENALVLGRTRCIRMLNAAALIYAQWNNANI